MPTVITILTTSVVATGTHSFGPVSVPVGVSASQVDVDRTRATSPTLRANWVLDLSLDGGATWLEWGGAGTRGGVFTDPASGVPWSRSSLFVGLLTVVNTVTNVTKTGCATVGLNEVLVPGFETTNVNRMIQGTVSVNEAVTTNVLLTLLP